MRILAVNCGSSSLKFAIYDVTFDVIARPPAPLAAGDISCDDHVTAVRQLMADLQHRGMLDGVAAVGHRLAHGGARHAAPVRLTPAILRELHTLVALAPTHLPYELRAVEAVQRHLPAVPQVACFDTAFHARMPRVARLYGLPHRLAEQGVVRYGFHGLSYEFVVETLRNTGALGERTVVAHLGSGASLAAVRDGVSIDTSMGFTPTGGVVMATRSGDLDPGILLYLLREQRLSPDEVSDIVRKEGGLAGLSGGISDMRDLLRRAATDPRAEEAIAVFCYQVSKWIGSYVAALGGLDTLVFTGGVGERGAPVRARVCERLACFGVRTDVTRNAAHAPVISAAGSPVTVRVIRTNEEIVIARHSWRLFGADK